MNTDVVIVGAGPAGIFTALEMLRCGAKDKIVLVEKGQSIENRHCPKEKTHKCMNCKPNCHITTGFSGAGAFSDGKLSLSYEVGGSGTVLDVTFVPSGVFHWIATCKVSSPLVSLDIQTTAMCRGREVVLSPAY